MRRIALTLLAFVALVSAASAAPSRYAPGELLVIRRPGGALDPQPGGALGVRDGRLASVLSRHGLGRWQELGTTGVRHGASTTWVKLVSTNADFDPVAAARDLMQTGAVVAAAPNLKLKLYVTLPNDTHLGDEYWVIDNGDADVQLADAWDFDKGDTSITIGVMDTGVDRTHPDLAGQIWRNWGEVDGNGVDDDGDGYIDDVNGWDFGQDDNDPNPHPVFDEATGIDVGFHGTFVAGLASAATNNSEGIAGAGWNCRIMPLKVADSDGNITLEATTGAFRYAWAHHVSVLNMSLGTADTTARAYFQAMVDSATAQGVLCVASAGNEGLSDPSFPASCNHVLSVGATDDANLRASFSNWGPTVDVSAPGSSVYSLICQNYVVDDFSQVFYLYLWAWDGETPYMLGDGTSFSCPIVSGVCGLARWRWPALTPDQVIQQVVATGDVVAYDRPIGRKLNALRAVTQAVLAAPNPGRAALARAWPNPFRATASFDFTLARAGDARVTLYDAAGRCVQTLVSAALPAGPNQARWDGRDAGGGEAPAGLYFARVQGPGLDRTLRVVRIE